MDDTFVIHKEANKQGFLQHINSVDPAIKFTVEDNKEDGSIPFLDTIVKPEADGTLSITVYRKPTHTDQYVQWDSHHHLSAKFSVIHMLSHRATTVCSKSELHQQEKDQLRKALTKCKYLKWALDKVEKRLNRSISEVIDGVNNQGTTAAQLVSNEVKIRVTLLYPTHKVFVKASKRSVVDMAFKPTSKVAGPSRAFWSPPRTKTLWSTEVVPSIWYQCGDIGCDYEYIGETSRTFGERYKEHLKVPSAIHHHSSQTGHPTSHNNFQIIGREMHNLARNIKESIYIRVNNPTLNYNIGKFNLPLIWDRGLLNTKGLNLKRQVSNNNTQFN